MSTYTAKDVQEVFATFVEAATRVGFDTEQWTLQSDMSGWNHHTHKSPNGEVTSGLWDTEFRVRLGTSAREAYNTLSTRIDTLRAVRELEVSR